MKLNDIKHILDQPDPEPSSSPTLMFVAAVNKTPQPRFWLATRQPEDWDHVRHITGMLFYAWDDKNPQDGAVYVGEWQ